MIIAYCCAFLAAFFWGAGFIGSRFGLEAMGPMWVCFFRFFVAFKLQFQRIKGRGSLLFLSSSNDVFTN